MKTICKYILTIFTILMITTPVWAISNAEVTVISDPSVGGSVAINSSNSATDWGTNKSKTQEGGFWAVNKNFTFYRFASAATGYTFKGWSTSQTANSGETNSQFTAQGGGAGTKSYTYYAIFATLQSSAHNTTVSFDNTKVDEQSSKSITIKHSHAGTVSLSLSGTNAGDFLLSENSFTSTSYQEGRNITIYFKPTCVGERTATLTISSNNGLNALTIYLKGNGLRHTPTDITWQEPIDVNMFIGDSRTVNVNSTTDGNITYSSSNTSVLSVSGNTLTAKAEGTAVITAIQAETCKYEASSITKEFYVHNKKTPTFWLNGDPNQLTDNLKTEDTRTITITNVDERMTADYDPNLLSYTFNGSTATIKALNAGTATLKLTQPENNQIFYGERTFTFNITKYDTNTITNDLATEYLVDDVVTEADIYTINNNELPVEIISGNNNILKFENGQLKAVNAGTTTITVKQAETNKWVGISAVKTITVKKHTPVFTWSNSPIYFNRTYTDYFSTSNKDTEITINEIVGQTDNEVAELQFSSNNSDKHTLDLITYYQETTPASSTTITVIQAENYYWAPKLETRTITPTNENDHVQFTIDKNNYTDLIKNLPREKFTWSDSKHFVLGNDNLSVGNTNDKYVIISFSGIPKDITFDYAVTQSGLATGIQWYVQESTNGTDWSNVFDETNKNAERVKRNLKPETRYIKFIYSGNYGGVFKNITITELNDFEAVLGNDDRTTINDDELDFGDNPVNKNNYPQKTFDLRYANAGYKVLLSVEGDDRFTVSPTSITTIGGEKSGTYSPINVIYETSSQHTSAANAKLVITDEKGLREEIALVGSTYPSPQTLSWTAEWTADKPIVILNQTVTNAATNGMTDALPIKYRSSDETVLDVSDDGYSFTALKAGEALITAYQEGNEEYASAEISKTFMVSNKYVQNIVFENDLTSLYVGDADVILTAKVYVLNAETHEWNFSQERTDLLTYTSPNPSVVSISGNVLSIHGIGEMFIQAAVAGDERYEATSLSIPVRVREVPQGCDDVLLPIKGRNFTDQLEYDPYQSTEQFTLEIDRSYGVPGQLSFYYYGSKAWGTLDGEIQVMQSTDGGANWTELTTVTPTTDATYSPTLPLSREATHLRFQRINQLNLGYHYVQYVAIQPAQYIESHTIDFRDIVVNSSSTRNLTVAYSNIKDTELAISTPTPSLIRFSVNAIEDNCGAWGEQTISVTLTPNQIGAFEGYVYIKDDVTQITCTAKVVANVQSATPIFVGGGVDNSWTTPTNWNLNRVPNAEDSVIITAPIEISDGAVEVLGMTINAGGAIHITPTGGLTVGEGGIVGATEDNFTIDNNTQGVGFLRINPDAKSIPTNVTINYTTRGKSGNPRDEVWQYIGAPGANMSMTNEGMLIYHWSEQNGWVKATTAMAPFVGYAISRTTTGNDTYTITTTPVFDNHTIELTRTPSGMDGSNLFVNSYLAPIDLAKFELGVDIVGDVEQTFYLFNSGSWNDWQNDGGGDESIVNGSSPGQYFAITPGSAALLDASMDQTTIPPMQGVYVVANESATIRLDYNKHVFTSTSADMNRPMRAPQQQDQNFMRVRIQVNSDNSGADRMYVIQHENATKGYDNGYDAKNILADGQANIYTHEQDGQMEISVTNQLDSTYIGFAAGDDAVYTLTFTSLVGEEMYLYDIEQDILIPLAEQEQYTFYAQPNSVNNQRFILLLNPDDAGNMSGGDGVTTDIENLSASSHIWFSGKTLHVADAPANTTLAIYSACGMCIMAPNVIPSVPYALDLSHLPMGVYVLRLNNQAYKFVCK